MFLIKVLGLAFGLACAAPAGATCSATITNHIAFTYNGLTKAAATSTANLDYFCSELNDSTIYLGKGEWGANVLDRRMRGPGGTLLKYNLYTSASLSQVWGDGKFAPGVSRPKQWGNSFHTIYGQIPGGVNVPVGTYTDSIVITWSF